MNTRAAVRNSRAPSSNIYRRVSCRIWADERFRKLSSPKPNAQTLWFHLLFGEQTGIVPGLFRVGEAGFAEQLGWPLSGFRKAFGEVEQQGMVRADWECRLVWVPKAIRYNPPASPNVVRHWGTEWHLLPECQMRSDAQALLEDYLQGIGQGFREAFSKVVSGVLVELSAEDCAEDFAQSGAVAVAVAGSKSPLTPQAGNLSP